MATLSFRSIAFFAVFFHAVVGSINEESQNSSTQLDGSAEFSNIVDAARSGNMFAVQGFLLNSSTIDVNIRDSENWTSLHWVARHGDVNVTSLLVDRGADVNATLSNGTSALQWAAWAGQARVMEVLIARGASINHVDDNLGWTALHWASAESNETVKVLLDAGCQIDVMGKDGLTPLHLAILQEKLESAQLLLENGAIVNSRSEEHGTPLQAAVSAGLDTLVAKLLQHGADPNPPGGPLPLLHIAAARGSVDIARALLDAGVDRDMRDPDVDLTPLHIAARANSTSIAELLIERGASVNATLRHSAGGGSTPLQMAAARGLVEFMEILLRAGADVNQTDSRGRTAVTFARAGGHAAAVELLVRHGAAAAAADDSAHKDDGEDDDRPIRIGIFGLPGGGSGGGLGGGLAELAERLLGSESRGGGGDGGRKSRFERASNVTARFADVAGCDEAKAELADLAAFLREPARFTRLGGRVPKGYLLSGPPGTGKTLLARAVAGEANVTFIHASGAEFEEVRHVHQWGRGGRHGGT
jgi:ankyrin repeat protein